MAGLTAGGIDFLALLKAGSDPVGPALRCVTSRKRGKELERACLARVRRRRRDHAALSNAVPEGEEVSGYGLQLVVGEEVELGHDRVGGESAGVLEVRYLPSLAPLASHIREVGPGALGAEDHGIVEGVVAAFRHCSHGGVLQPHILRVTVVAPVAVEELAALGFLITVLLGDDRLGWIPHDLGDEHYHRDYREEDDQPADDDQPKRHPHGAFTFSSRLRAWWAPPPEGSRAPRPVRGRLRGRRSPAWDAAPACA
jgi:hypothetical protein